VHKAQVWFVALTLSALDGVFVKVLSASRHFLWNFALGMWITSQNGRAVRGCLLTLMSRVCYNLFAGKRSDLLG
jgi:hypothetical protein